MSNASHRGPAILTAISLLNIFLQLDADAQQLNILTQVSRRFRRLVEYPLLWEKVFHASGYVLPLDIKSRLRGTVETPPGRWDGSRFEWDPPTSEEDEKELDDEWTLMKPSIRCSNRDRPHAIQRADPLDREWGQADIPIHWPTLLRSMSVYDSRLARADSRRALVLTEHSKAVYCVKFAGSRMITGSRDRTIGFWRLGAADARGRVTETKLITKLLTPHTRSVVSIAYDFDCEVPFDSDGNEDDTDADTRGRASLLVSSSSDGSVAIWRVTWSDDRPAANEEDCVQVDLVKMYRDGTGPVFDVILTPTRIVTAASDGWLRTYYRHNLEIAETLVNGPRAVNALAQTAPGREAFVAVGLDHTIAEWTWTDQGWVQETTEIDAFKIATIDIRVGLNTQCLVPKPGTWYGADGNQDGYYAIGGAERVAKIYHHGEVWDKCPGHMDTIRAIALDPGRPLMTSADYQGFIMVRCRLRSPLLLPGSPAPLRSLSIPLHTLLAALSHLSSF